MTQSLIDRGIAARIYGYKPCKRGLAALGEVAWSLQSDLVIDVGETGFPRGPKRRLFQDVLFAISRIDSQASHSVLRRFLDLNQNPHLRSDVLEAMAHELEAYDTQLILDILKNESQEPMILSGLYALMFPGAGPRTAGLRECASSFLTHQSGSVRAFAVRVLMTTGKDRDTISRLSNDQDPGVQEAVADALRFLRMRPRVLRQ